MACGEVRRVFRSETDEYNERVGEMGCIPRGNIHRERINPGRGVSSKLPLNNTVYQYIYIYKYIDWFERTIKRANDGKGFH